MKNLVQTALNCINEFSKKRGISLMYAILSGISFTMSNFMVQVVIVCDKNIRIHTMEIVLARCLVQLVFSFLLLSILHVPLFSELRDLVILLPLGFVGYFTVVATYLSLDKIPISDTLLITFTSPFFCALFSICILREGLHYLDAVCGLISFIGVGIVARPSFIFGNESEKKALLQENDVTKTHHEHVYLLGVFYAILGAVFLALYFVLTRKCSSQIKLSTILPVFYPSLIGSIASSFFMYFRQETFLIPQCAFGILILISVGVLSTLGLTFITLSLGFEQAFIVNLIRNLDVIYAFILQYFVFDISPNKWNISGGIIILLSTVLVVVRQWLSRRGTKEVSSNSD